MVLQSKLLLRNGTNSIELERYNNDDLDRLDFTEVPSVKEYSNFDIKLEIENNNCYFEIPELDDYYITNKDEGDENSKYMANQWYSVFNYEDQSVPLIPGIYTIKIVEENETFFSYFLIVPKDLSKPDWELMKQDVERKVKGLAIDFSQKKQIRQESTDKKDNDISNFNSRINLFLSKEKELRFVIEKLKKEAKYKINKHYRWEPLGAKNLIDSVTIRKMSERPDKKNMIYAAKRFLDYDVPENRWLKYILRELLNFTKKSIDMLNGLKEFFKSDRAEESRFDNRRAISDVEFQKRKLNTNLVNLDEKIEKLTIVKSYISSFLSEYFVMGKNIKLSHTLPKSFMVNANYNFLYKLLISLDKNQQETNLDNFYDYYWKDTAKLYEIWTFIKTIEAIIAIGYQPVKGWIYNVNPFEQIIPKLVSGEDVFFINEKKQQLRLIYNEEIPHKGKSSFKHPLITHSNRNKPDIRLDMFTSDEAYAGSILMDAKYKKLKSLLKTRNIHNKVSEQFREYKNDPFVTKEYWHIKDSFRAQVSPVNSVIVLYPNNEDNDKEYVFSERYIYMSELNPHKGLEEYSILLREKIDNVYLVFEDWRV